jgi:hypothetical protein
MPTRKQPPDAPRQPGPPAIKHLNESWHKHLSRSKTLIAATGISGDAKRLGGGELVLNT